MSSDDTTSTAEDFNSLEVTDTGPKTETRGTVFGVNGVSATGSTEKDREIGYSDGRGNPGPNFEAFGGVTNEMGEPVGKRTQTPSEFAAALEATQGGGTTDTTGSISIPSIEAASPNLTPGILGETLSDFQSGVRPITGEEDTPANQMLEAAIASRPTDYSELDLIPTTGFVPAEVTRSKIPGPTTQAAIAATLNMLDQRKNERAGLGDPRGIIDFGVTQQLLPATTPIARPVDRIAAMTMPGTAMGTIPTEEIDDLADTEFAAPRGTGTTATGTNLPKDFEENVGRAFSPERMADIERLYNLSVGQTGEGTGKDPNFMDSSKGTDPAFFEGLGIPGPLASFGDKAEMLTREQMATDIALGRPRSAFEMLKGFTATPAESIEEFNKRMDTIPENQLVRNNSGRVIGIKDADGRLVTGMDPDARVQATSDGGEQVTKAPPKAPTDPCPDGYQLIDGKCTPTGATDTGTGFMMFPADRTPPFRTGPFTPTTVATNPNIQALNPVTFGLSNIFRR